MVITLPDELASILQDIAKKEKRTPEDVLKTMFKQYTSMPVVKTNDYYHADNIKKRLYERARNYWQKVNNQERLMLTDEDLKEQFWLFDQDGIPRLKSDQGIIESSPNSLLSIAASAEELGLSSERDDISDNFKDVLRETWAEYSDKK